MRYQIIKCIALIFISFNCFGQRFPDFYEVKGDVRLIEYESIGSSMHEIAEWTGRSYYKNGQIQKLKGFYNGEVVSVEKYKYIDTHNGRIIYKKEKSGEYEIHREEVYSGAILEKISYHLREKSSYSKMIIDDILYDDQNRVSSYITYYEIPNADTLNGGHSEIRYYQDSIIVRTTHQDDNRNDLVESYILDDDSNPEYNYLITGFNANSGIKSGYSRYVFDNKGNWIEVYRRNEDGTDRLTFRREIYYR